METLQIIDWSKYFDRIYCIHFVQYTKRRQLLEFELNRVGILNSGIFQYYFTDNGGEEFCIWMRNKYVSKYLTNLNHHYVSVALGHYYVIRDAYFKGYQHILILEDDMRFLKDLNKIKQILEHKPKNGNVIMYDKYIEFYKSIEQFKSINDYYSTFSACWSAGCYQLDRVGMEKIIALQETVKLLNPDNYFFSSRWFIPNLNRYCSNTNIAVQCQFKTSQTSFYDQFFNKTKNMNIIFKCYKHLNINFDDYMMRKDGQPYYYGDYIIQKEYPNELPITDEQNKQMMLLNKKHQPIEMNICLAVTINYIDKLLPILYSMEKYSESKFNVYIIINSNIEIYKDFFKPFNNQKMSVTLLDSKIIRDNIDKIYDQQTLTHLTFAKLVIPTLFPNLDRILYLDYDTLILKEGLEWFYNIDFRNNYIAASEDRIIYNKLQGYGGWKSADFEENLFKDSNLYFNAGVILYNLKKIREDNKDKQLMNILKHKPNNLRVVLADQTLMNIVFKNTALRINPIFNSFCPHITQCFKNIEWKRRCKQKFNIDNKTQFFNRVVISHFACGKKPWLDIRENVLLDDDKKRIYDQYKIICNELMEKLNEYYMV